MPQDLTDVDEFTSPVSVPIDGDFANEASVSTPFQALANRALYLLNRLGQIAIHKDGSALTVRKAIDFLGANFVVADNAGTGRTEVSLVGPPQLVEGGVLGCLLAWNSASTVLIHPGACRDNDDTVTIEAAAELTVDITASGAGGLDSGAEAPSTWYQVHLIGDTTGSNPSAGLMTASGGAPELPTGYDVFRFLGNVYNDAGGDLRAFTMFDLGEYREVYYADDVQLADLLALDAGVAGTWAAVDCAEWLPPMFTVMAIASLLNEQDYEPAGGYMQVRISGSANGDPPVRVYPSGNAEQRIVSTVNFTALEYQQVTDGNLTIWVRGYRERLVTGLVEPG